jgi:long-chain acyl-CoA synthetase
LVADKKQPDTFGDRARPQAKRIDKGAPALILNPFRPKELADPGEELVASSETPLTIPRMVADSRARFGERIAYQQVRGKQWEPLTYETVWQRAREFAAGLIALGLKKGDRVAIISENSLDWTIAYLGQSMAGGIGVPLYLELKKGEIDELVKRAECRMAIVSPQVLERVDEKLPGVETIIVIGASAERSASAPGFMRRARPGLVPFDQVPQHASDESRAELERRLVEPDDLASIVFTSGTTGGMKGVMLTHKNLMSNVESIRRALQFDEKDSILLVLPLHHAFPFIVLMASFAIGGTLTFENELMRVRDRLEEVKPTVFVGVPALYTLMYRAILGRLESEGRLEEFQRGLRVVDVARRRTGVHLGRLIFRELHNRLGGRLRILASGGAALNPDVQRNYLRLGLPLIQGWGMSEASPGVAAQRWNPRKFFFSTYYEEQCGSVGPPLPGVEVGMIDVPEKEIYVNLHGEGELVVRGPNVFAGYWKAEEATNAAKVGGWLRTGDLGRIDEEGNIWITGRSKYIIVLDSGEKVVPDELEEHYRESEFIQDICVVPSHNRKAQVGSIVYPNLDAIRSRLSEQNQPVSEAAVRSLIQAELDRIAGELAPHKRIMDLVLTDTPLPKTALQDVARGQIKDSYSFDVKRWQESGGLAPPPTPPDQAE